MPAGAKKLTRPSDFSKRKKKERRNGKVKHMGEAGVRETCMEFVSPLGSVFNIDSLHEIPTSSFCL